MTPPRPRPTVRLTRPNLRRVLATLIAVLLAMIAYQTLGPSADDGGVQLSTSSVLTGPSRLQSAATPAPTPTPIPTTAPLLLPSPTPTPAPTVADDRASRGANPPRVAVAQAGAVAPQPTAPPAAAPAPTSAPAPAAVPAPTSAPAPAAVPTTPAAAATSPAVAAPVPTATAEALPQAATAVPIDPLTVIVVTPAPTSTPIPAPTSAPANSSGLVYYVLGQINSVRAQSGLGPLTLSPELSTIAADWSVQMAAAGGISHRPHTQLTAMMPAGWRMWAENVATAPDIYIAQSALESSPGHYANMVGSSFTHIGIGIAYGDYGSVWITQNFATY